MSKATESAPSAKPKGWEKLSREGSREGAEVGWDEDAKRFFHVLANGSILYHDRPEGVHLVRDADGGPVLVPAGMQLDRRTQQMVPKAEAETSASPAAPAAKNEATD